MNILAVYTIGGAILGGGIGCALNLARTDETNMTDIKGIKVDIIKSAIFGGLLAGALKLLLRNAS